VQSEELWMDLRTLHRHGWSIAALARKFQLNRRTVRREVAGERPRGYPRRPTRYPLTEAQLAHVQRRLLVCPGIRGTDRHRELAREYDYRGSYPTFQRTLRPLRAAQPGRPGRVVSSLNWVPGETVASGMTATLSSGGAPDFYIPFGQADLVVDVVGWQSP
jgi:hypothetical protein